MQTFKNFIKQAMKHKIDWCYGDSNKVPCIPSDAKLGGSRFSDSIKCSEKTEEGKYFGIILKEDGIMFDGEKLVVVDVDAKTKYGNTESDQQDLFEKVKHVLRLDKRYPHVERTVNGGFHIYLKLNESESASYNDNSSVPVKKGIVDGKEKVIQEVELFVKSRFMVMYEAIDFDDLDYTSIAELENLKFLQEIKTEKECDYETGEMNTGSTSTYLKKAVESIPEIKAFATGEWAGYNFVFDEIFRFYIALNKEDEFLEVVKQFHPKHFHVWQHFPKKYLGATGNNRLPKSGAQHTGWLKRTGFFKGASEKKDNKNKMMPVFEKIAGKNPVKIGDSAFIYNGKSYEWLDPSKYVQTIYDVWFEMYGDLLDKEKVNEMIHHFTMFLHIKGIEYNPADKLKKVVSVNLAFSNGTVYVTKNNITFRENYFSPEDKVFIEFVIPYSADFKKGLFTEWVMARFNTKSKQEFFQMIIGDIFTTDSTTDVHGYFWGGAEIGKSTFSALLQKITTNGTVDFMKLDKIKDKFSRVRTLRTPIMIADESSERNIPESEYKSTISREPDDYEMKNIQNFTGQPIAKIITFANVLPNIKMDDGVKRRLCVLQVETGKVATHLSKEEFAEELGRCGNELVDFILKGILMCFSENWDVSGFYKENFCQEQKTTIFVNDSFAYFVNSVFQKMDTLDHELAISSMDAYRIYNEFLSTLEGTAMHKMTVTKFGLKLREMGIDNKETKVSYKKFRYLSGIKNTQKSLELLLKTHPDEKDLENNKIRLKIAELLKK